MDITRIGCAPGNFRKGRPSPYLPIAIVIHIMDGTLRGTDQWFNDPASKVSAHYGIGRKGEVHQYVDESDTAFHAGIVVNPASALVKARPSVNPNYYTIGIEHEGRRSDPWTDVQLQTSILLVAQVALRWRIPLDRDHVLKHHEIRQSKTCPGDWINVDDLVTQVRDVAEAFTTIRAPMSVRILANVRLREKHPSTLAPVVGVLAANTSVRVAGFTNSGESVQQNSTWFQDFDGHYFWAGATDNPHPAATMAAGA